MSDSVSTVVMNPKDRETISLNINSLSKSIDLNLNLLNQSINKNIFTQQMIDDILKISDKMEQKKRFLYDLTRRGPEAYDKFVEVLFGVDQIDAARVLKPYSFQSELSQEELIESITSTPPPPPDSSAGTYGRGLDSGDHSRSGHLVATVENDDFMVIVQKSKKPMIGRNIYRITSSPRGFCLLFNNFDFVDPAFDKRMGSETEGNRLRDVFSQLHFTVEVRNNTTKERMFQTMNEFSKKSELTRHDAFVLIVLSHGVRGGHVITSDGMGINTEDIIKKFNNENCPNLINRPKLFFFNCCRGDTKDSGPKYQYEEAVADAKRITEPEKPNCATFGDQIICYSTIDGYVSWRNEENGSWFGNALAQSLMKFSHDTELHHILLSTSNLVSNKSTQNGEKQVMEFVNRGFCKMFYFNPGVIKNSLSTDY